MQHQFAAVGAGDDEGDLRDYIAVGVMPLVGLYAGQVALTGFGRVNVRNRACAECSHADIELRILQGREVDDLCFLGHAGSIGNLGEYRTSKEQKESSRNK